VHNYVQWWTPRKLSNKLPHGQWTFTTRPCHGYPSYNRVTAINHSLASRCSMVEYISQNAFTIDSYRSSPSTFRKRDAPAIPPTSGEMVKIARKRTQTRAQYWIASKMNGRVKHANQECEGASPRKQTHEGSEDKRRNQSCPRQS
jgi:hypothetical protein